MSGRANDERDAVLFHCADESELLELLKGEIPAVAREVCFQRLIENLIGFSGVAFNMNFARVATRVFASLLALAAPNYLPAQYTRSIQTVALKVICRSVSELFVVFGVKTGGFKRPQSR
jgi:hypothetical protein